MNILGQPEIERIVRLYGEATTTIIQDHLIEKYNLKPTYDIRITITRRLNKLKDWEKIDRKLGEKKMGGREMIWFPKK